MTAGPLSPQFPPQHSALASEQPAVQPPLSALVDTSVLLSDPLRDWLIRLAGRAPELTLHWTKDVQREFWAGLRHRHPEWDIRQRREAERGWLDACAPEPITGYPRIIRAHVRDGEDAHLDSAAEHAGLDVLVTDDTRAFRPSIRTCYRLLSADAFLCLLAAAHPSSLRCADPAEQARLLGASGAAEFARLVAAGPPADSSPAEA